MEPTVDQLKAAARRAAEDGNASAARSLIGRAQAAEKAVSAGTTPELMALLSKAPGGAGSGAGPDVLDPIQGDPTSVSDVLDNVVGGFRPEMSPGEKLGTALNKGGESMTFGLVGDELSLRPEHYREQEARLEQENPGLALGAEIGGAVAGAALPIGAISQTGSLMPRIGKSIAAGGLMGGVYGAMEGEGSRQRREQALTGAGFGAAGGALAPAFGAGTKKIADALVRRRPIQQALRGAKTAAQQRAASGAWYDAFENADAQISPEAMTRLRRSMVDRLAREGQSSLPGTDGLNPGAERISRIVSQMDDQVQSAAAAGQNPAVPLKSIDDLRRVAGDVAQDVNPIGRATKDARLGSIAIEEIDGFINGLQAGDVPIGNGEEARKALLKAREVWSRASKTQLIENALDAQDDYLGGAASAIRNKVGTLLRNPKTRRQFNEAELAQLRKIIGGNAVTRAIRSAGNGLGRQLQMIGGSAVGGIPGALAGAVTGEITSGLAERNAVKAAETVRSLVASGALQNLPEASPAVRRITEQLVRRIGAVAPQ